MRTVLVFGILACASSAMADPQSMATEIFHLRTECGKMAEDWLARVKENILGNELVSAGFSPNVTAHYNPRSNRYYLLEFRLFYDQRTPKKEQFTEYKLFDAQERRLISLKSGDSSLIDHKRVSSQEALDYIMCMMRDDDCDK